MGRKYEDILDEVRELDSDLASELEEFKASSLRQKAAERDALAKERDDLKAELEGIKGASARQKAFEEYGIDFSQLSKLEKKALETYDGELTPEAIGEFVEENEIPVAESEEGEGEREESGAEKIARAAQRAGANGGRAPVVRPEDVQDWPTQKLMEFREKHPEEFEALKRGETVTGVAV